MKEINVTNNLIKNAKSFGIAYIYKCGFKNNAIFAFINNVQKDEKF